MASVALENVTVKYPIYNAGGLSLRHALLAVGTGGRLLQEARRVVTVTALDNVSFELKDGDRVGLVGHNGSGKSTLLRTVAGIFRPMTGRISVEGRVSTVFDLGAGMQAELSGYENIIRMSMLLGASRTEAEASVPDVESFSELGDFLRVPVRTYSSGMQTRLAFAVATSVHPEVLLIDEVLGAGDSAFQAKAQKRMEEFIETSSILILASHSPQLIERYCNQQIRLDHGRLVEPAGTDV